MKIEQEKELRKSLKQNGIKLLDCVLSPMDKECNEVWKIIIESEYHDVCSISLSYNKEFVEFNGIVSVTTLTIIDECLKGLANTND